MKGIVGMIFTLLLAAQVFAGVQILDGTTNRGVTSKIKCSTGLSCVKENDKVTITVAQPTLSLANGEVIQNSTDDTVDVLSDDNHTTLQVTGFEAKNAILNLWADQGDDAADKFYMKMDTSDVFSMGNNATELATMSTAGDWVFKGTTPYLTIGDDGAEDSGIVFDEASLNFNISVDSSAGTLVLGKGTSAGTTDAIRIDTNQDVTFVQNVLGLGTDSISGFLQKQVAATATTITAAQCGSTFINSGAVEMELPEASTVVGCRLTFITGNASNFDIDPDGGDQILVQTNAAGDAMRNATLGNSITIEAISASQWAPVAVSGTWSDIN